MNQDKPIIISVGAGFPQTPFIRALKEKGYKVAAFGKGKNDPEAIVLCDYFETIDTTNSKDAIQWIESLDEKPLACGSYAGGGAIDTLQAIDRHFNFTTQIPEFLSVGMNKVTQQKLYKELGLSGIGTYTIDEIKRNNQLLDDDVKYILKPVIGRGSSGVYKLFGSEIKEWIRINKTDDKDVVQNFVEGEEYRLMAIVQAGELKFLAQIKRESLKGTFLLGRLSVTDVYKNELNTFMQKLVKNCGIKSSIIKLDVLVSEHRVDMIEMDIGVGGGIYFKDFINVAYDYDVDDNYIRLITDEAVERVGRHNTKIKMDYVFNQKGKTINFDQDMISKWLDERVGKHHLVFNLMNEGVKGSFSSNAHFIFTVIHSSQSVSTIQLNEEINEFFFK